MKERHKQINLVIIPIPVDKGMAGTTRLRNFIKYLPKENMRVTNLITSSEDKSYPFLGAEVNHLNVSDNGYREILNRFKKELSGLFNPAGRNILFFYDIPHPPYFILLLRWARKRGYTVVVDVVEDYNTQIFNLGTRGNLRLLLSGTTQKYMSVYADAAIGISGYLMGFLKKYLPGKPVIHLPVAFDPENIVETHITASDSNQISVFYGGTFGEKDGMEHLLKGFEYASSKNNNIVLTMTGKGSRLDMEKFETLVRHSSARDKILNHGFVSYEDYCQILGSAQILCMTRINSRFANAGFPYKLGEFLATGKPVIVSRLPEIQNFVPADACCYVTPESGEEIGEAILSLTNQVKRKEVGCRGKAVAFANFDARNISRQLYDFLNSLGSNKKQ
jgi:glycosyltransferase involved in cell wall biosynthesis